MSIMQVMSIITEITEIKGDLFTCDKASSMAHCVAKDLGMGKGIAVLFKKKFGGLIELKAQNPEIGSVAVLERNDRFIYYLITKSRSRDYPTIENLKKSLEKMRDHAMTNDIKMISMPRIGSGLDKLDWNDVSKEITNVFKETCIKINIYIYV